MQNPEEYFYPPENMDTFYKDTTPKQREESAFSFNSPLKKGKSDVYEYQPILKTEGTEGKLNKSTLTM